MLKIPVFLAIVSDMRSFYWLFVFTAIIAIAPGSALSGTLVALTENNPPFNFLESNVPSGIAVDLFMSMTKEAGIPFELKDIRFMPWARGYHELLSKPNVVLFAMARTAERENLFQWVGPIVTVNAILAAHRSKNVEISNFKQDIKAYSVGTVRGCASERFLISRGARPVNIQCVHELDLNIRKLNLGRVDLIAINEPAFWYSVKKAGLDPSEFKVAYHLDEMEFYFGMSRGVAPSVVKKMQRALDRLRACGALKGIIAKYM